MTVDALVVEGAADEFLLGEDWVMRNGVKIDFTSCEMKWAVPSGAGDEGQILDDEIRGEQARDKTVKKLLEKSKCNDRAIVVADGIVCIRETDGSSRVLLPTALWVKVLKENHDSERKDACATVGTVVQGLRAQEGEDEEVISPLRSQGIGNQGDRWAPDVVGPRSITPNGNRNVVAAVD
ncbi:hypothetical protein Pcac1_g24364 [Phytophthora cactorum]|nr:hypothetical protein Pcac1_g24364 [Phytophthora cactorum]